MHNAGSAGAAAAADDYNDDYDYDVDGGLGMSMCRRMRLRRAVPMWTWVCLRGGVSRSARCEACGEGGGASASCSEARADWALRR